MSARGALCCVVAVAAVALPSTAAAATETAMMPFALDLPACSGDTIHLSGQLMGVFTFTQNGAGGALVASHIQPQGVSGSDLTTGTTYLGTGQTSDRIVATPSGGSSFTFIDRFHIQATHGAESYDVSVTIHVTTLADGTVTASVGNVSAPC